MEGGFVLDHWHVFAGGVDASAVIPIHLFERRERDLVERTPRPFSLISSVLYSPLMDSASALS
jgi:hypothetical protein